MTDLNGKLFIAAKSGDTATCAHLLSRGANINAVDDKRYTPVHHAAENGHTNTVMLLLDSSGNGRAYFGMIAMHYAARGGKVDTVHALVMGGLDANTLDSHEYTPMHIAAQKGLTETVRKLLEHGGDHGLTANKFRGETPLHLAAGAGQVAVVLLLIEVGAEVNKKDRMGATALHYAAESSHIDTIIALVRHGAEINARDNNGWTPLHFAGKFGHTDAVNTILDLGADIEAKEYIFKHTPLKLASDGIHTETILAFVKRGAKTSKQKALSGPKRV